MARHVGVRIGVVTIAAMIAVLAQCRPAAASTVTCSGSQTPTTATTITYIPGGSCTFTDAQTGNNTTSSIAIVFFVGSHNVAGFIGTGSSTSLTAHDGCSIAEFTAAAGGSCASNRTANGTETATVSSKASDGTRYTMTASYTVAAGGTSYTVNSASVTITPASGSSSSQTSTPSSAAQALSSAVAKSEIRFTTQNIQRHIDVLTSGGVAGAIGGPSPSGGGATGGGTPGQQSGQQQSQFRDITLVREPGNGFDGGTGAYRRAALGLNRSPFDQDILADRQQPYGGASPDDDGGLHRERGFQAFRALAAQVLPSLSYDSARGDTLMRSINRLIAGVSGNFAGGTTDPYTGQRVNQAQQTLPGNVPQRPRDVPRGPKDAHTWLYAAYSNVDNSRNEGTDDQRFNGDLITVTGGVDKWINSKWLAGVALSYSNVQLTTTFNDGDYAENAYTLSPYVLFRPFDWLAINASAGYTLSNVDQNQDRTANLAHSETDAGTWFGAINAKATYRADAIPLTIAASVGYTKSRRGIDAFTDSLNSRTDKEHTSSSLLRTGIEAGYTFAFAGQTLEPFVTVDLLHEYQDTTNGDKESGEVGGGLRWGDAALGLNASIESSVVVGRKDYSQYNIRGIIVKGFDSEALMGRLSPGLHMGLAADGETVGVGLDYAHRSGAFTASLTADIRRTLYTFDDSVTSSDNTADREGIVMLRARAGF